MGGGITHLIRGGGPFLIQASSSLVSDVLTRLKYLSSGDDLGEAMALFINRNQKKLHQLGVVSDISKSALCSIFADQRHYQCWKVAVSDSGVRQRLYSLKLLVKLNASRNTVQNVATQYLKQHGQHLPRTVSYATCVDRFIRHVNRHDPDLRQTVVQKQTSSKKRQRRE